VRPLVRAQPTTVESAETVGIAIHIQRKNLKLTQLEVAEAAGVERAVVGRLELARDDTAQFRVVLSVVNALDMDLELRSRHWTPGGPYPVDPTTSVVELGLSLDTLDCLQAADIHEVGQLGSADDLIKLPEFSKGTELYEIVRVLNRRGLSLPTRRQRHLAKDRELEIFRLRVVEGLTLAEVGEQVGVQSERVRQILAASFGLKGRPPATKEHKRAATVKRRAEELAAAQTRQGELIATWRTGHDTRTLAEKFGLSLAAIEEVIATAATPDDRTARAQVRGSRRVRRNRWPIQ
jgi:transcriptional regulator with XRE-family HTH domain